MELLILLLIAGAVAIAAVALREDKWLKSQDDYSWLDVSEKIDLDEELASPAKKPAKKKSAKKTAKKAVKKTAKKAVKKTAKKAAKRR